MTPDWAAKPTSVPYAEFGDPQSLNLYSYVRNSPAVRVDADGHFDDPFGTFGGESAAGNRSQECKGYCTAEDEPGVEQRGGAQQGGNGNQDQSVKATAAVGPARDK